MTIVSEVNGYCQNPLQDSSSYTDILGLGLSIILKNLVYKMSLTKVYQIESLFHDGFLYFIESAA